MANENWQKLSREDKFKAHFDKWRSAPGIQFASPEVEAAYRERTQIVQDAVQLKKPARVPICPNIGFYPFKYAGITTREAMYDYDKLGMALRKFHADFGHDSLSPSPIYGSGKVFELLDYKLYRWPGHGVPETAPYQCVESEYMKADEYDELLNDPSGYFQRKYLPRIFGTLGPWQMLAPMTDILELPFLGGYVVPVGIPPVAESFEKFVAAGRAAFEWIGACGAIDNGNIGTLGIPIVLGGFTKAPFDTIGDTLRGTRAVMVDLFRQPKKLLAALERWVPLAIDMGVRACAVGHNPMVFIPLHKGADGFMSDKDFRTFYWPSLKAVILGLVKEGLVPWIFVEGGYNQRLDVIADPDIPAGTTAWIFDQTDMKEVKKRFAGWACFGGNVPVSLLKAGKPEEVKTFVKCLLDEVGQDGGYVLSTGAVLDDAEPENLHAFVDTAREYGVYR